MGLRRVGALLAGVLAALVGVLELPAHYGSGALAPFQRTLILAADGLLDRLQGDAAAGGGLDWATSFSGAMLPAEPVQDRALHVVKGAIPADLSGVYLRVGPSTVHWPPAKRTHVFDGDGVIYSIRFRHGKANYNCAYLRTPRYEYEQGVGHEWFMRLGELSGIPGLLKVLTTVRWKQKHSGLEQLDSSTANTAVGVTPDHRVWALNEGGFPFRFKVLENGAIESLGFDRLGGTLEVAVSAHPKYDYATGEVFFHGRDLMTQQFFVGRIEGGRLQEQVTLRADPPVGQGFNHDMFITKDYVVIIDGSTRFDPKAILKKGPLWNFEPEQRLRFAVYPRATRNLTSEAFVWISAPFSREIVHMMAAHNEGEKIVLYTSICEYDANRTQGILGYMGITQTTLLIIDVKERTVTEEAVEGAQEFISEFGRVREDRVGQRARFAYSSIERKEAWVEFNFTGVAKWDLDGRRRVGTIEYAPDVVGGEAIFMPKEGSSSEVGEDDGYLAVQLWNARSKVSSIAVYDAKTFAPEPVVELMVPKTRMPLGFHGWWLSEEELKQQLEAAAVP